MLITMLSHIYSVVGDITGFYQANMARQRVKLITRPSNECVQRKVTGFYISGIDLTYIV